MSRLICKHCNNHIAPMRKELPYANSANREYYVCPVCGKPLNGISRKKVILTLFVIIILWVTQFFYFHISKGNLHLSVALIITFLSCALSTSLLYYSYRLRIRKTKKYVYPLSIGLLLFLFSSYRMFLYGSVVWGI